MPTGWYETGLCGIRMKKHKLYRAKTTSLNVITAKDEDVVRFCTMLHFALTSYSIVEENKTITIQRMIDDLILNFQHQYKCDNMIIIDKPFELHPVIDIGFDNSGDQDRWFCEIYPMKGFVVGAQSNSLKWFILKIYALSMRAFPHLNWQYARF